MQQVGALRGQPVPEKEILREFLQSYLFPYFKFFDSDLVEDHEGNYYMDASTLLKYALLRQRAPRA